MSGAIVVIAVGLGLPLALRLTSGHPRRDPAVVAGIAATAGLVGQILAGIVLVRIGHFGTFTLVAASVAWCAAAFVVVRPPSDTTSTGGWRDTSLTTWLVLAPVLLALVVPKAPTYFVFETGDMGEYVNSANVAADIGRLIGGFPHGFTVLLANVHLLFGEARVDALTPALGALLVLATIAASRALGLGRAASAAAGVIVALNPVAVWFSVFPVSEVVYAVLVLGLAACVGTARSHVEARLAASTAVLAGITAGMLLLVRGNAMLLLPVVWAIQVISWVTDRRATARVQATFTFVASVSLFAAYAYNVKFLPLYFVQNQLEGQLPSGLFRRLGSLQLLGPSTVLAAVLVVGTLSAGVALVSIDRMRARRPDRVGGDLVARVGLAAAVVGATIYVVAAGSGGTMDGVERWGVGFCALGLGGLAWLLVGRARLDRVAWCVPVMIGAAGIGLYAKRVPEARNHAYYLYIDRYLFSEGFPVAALLGAAGLAGVVTVLRARPATVTAGVVAVAAAAAVVPVAPATALAIEQRLFGEAYEAVEDIADEVPPGAPIVYRGMDEPPDGWFFPNTFRALATPLTRTFDRRVVNLPAQPFAPDPVPSADDVLDALARTDSDIGYLFEVRTSEDGDPAGASLPPDAALVESRPYRVWVLPKRIERSEESFRAVDLVLYLYRIEVDAGA